MGSKKSKGLIKEEKGEKSKEERGEKSKEGKDEKSKEKKNGKSKEKKGEKSKVKKNGKSKKGNKAWLVVVTVAFWVTGIAIGVFTLVGCISSNGILRSLYIAELRTSNIFDFELRVGYFGGCANLMTIGKGPKISPNGDKKNIQCLGNMHNYDNDDIDGELHEEFDLLTDVANDELDKSLKSTLPIAKHLQTDVFPWRLSVSHLFLFFVSGIIFYGTTTSISRKCPYKLFSSLAILLGGFSLALVYTVAVGSTQILNGLVHGDSSIEEKEMSAGVSIVRGSYLYYAQAAQAASVTLFYILMVALLVFP